MWENSELHTSFTAMLAKCCSITPEMFSTQWDDWERSVALETIVVQLFFYFFPSSLQIFAHGDRWWTGGAVFWHESRVPLSRHDCSKAWLNYGGSSLSCYTWCWTKDVRTPDTATATGTESLFIESTSARLHLYSPNIQYWSKKRNVVDVDAPGESMSPCLPLLLKLALRLCYILSFF